MARGLSVFVTTLLWLTLSAAATAALAYAAPLAQVAVAGGLITCALVFFAARAGSPRWFGLRHLFGVLFALVGAAAHWSAWIAFVGGGLATPDMAAVVAAATAPLAAWPNRVEALAAGVSFQAGGLVVSDAALTAAWTLQAALMALCGFFGGHSAYWRARPRR